MDITFHSTHMLVREAKSFSHGYYFCFNIIDLIYCGFGGVFGVAVFS